MVIPIIYSDKYVIELEPVNLNGSLTVFIHAEITTWNKEVYKELQNKWAEFRTHYTSDIWALPRQTNTGKFAKMFGFIYRGTYMRHRV